MLTLPRIVELPARPYVAVRHKVVIPFDDVIPQIMAQLFGAIEAQKIQSPGEVIFKHEVIDMPRLDMAFGVLLPQPAEATGDLIAGELPAGRYAELTHVGPYDELLEVNAVLIGWAKHKGLQWDVEPRPDGDHFASRLEIYHNGPDDEPDPQKYRTTVSIKLRD